MYYSANGIVSQQLLHLAHLAADLKTLSTIYGDVTVKKDIDRNAPIAYNNDMDSKQRNKQKCKSLQIVVDEACIQCYNMFFNTRS